MLLVALYAVLPLGAAPSFPATTDTAAVFNVCSVDGGSCVASSYAELEGLPSATWGVGETVTLTSPSGVLTTLASSPSAAGAETLTSLIDAGGIWTFENSVHGKFRVGVPWSVYGDGGRRLVSGSFGPYKVDSAQDGPNRSVKRRDALPVAYTGDGWMGDVLPASTLAFTSPGGATTTLDLAGTGATNFTFGADGAWRVRLVETASGTEREAMISIYGGFVILFK